MSKLEKIVAVYHRCADSVIVTRITSLTLILSLRERRFTEYGMTGIPSPWGEGQDEGEADCLKRLIMQNLAK